MDVLKTGAVNVHQFCLAMVLIQKRMNATLAVIPSILPQNVIATLYLDSSLTTMALPSAANSVDTISMANRSSMLGVPSGYMTPMPGTPAPTGPSMIPMDEKLKFDGFYATLDASKKGFLTGMRIEMIYE